MAMDWVMGFPAVRRMRLVITETLFFSDFITHQVHEIEDGDYTTSSNLTESSWGGIKAGFCTP